MAETPSSEADVSAWQRPEQLAVVSRRIKILLAAQIVAVPLCAAIACSHQSPSTLLVAVVVPLYLFVLSQPGLLGLWGVFGNSRPWVRSLCVGLGLVCLWISIPIAVRGQALLRDLETVLRYGHLPAGWLDDFKGIVVCGLMVVLPALVVFIVLRALQRSRGLRLVRSPPQATPASLQFSIKHLMAATAIVATIIAARRGLQALGYYDHADFDDYKWAKNWLSVVVPIAALVPCVVLVELSTFWAALGLGRPLPRLTAVVSLAALLAIIPAFYLEAGAAWQSFMVGFISACCQVLLTGATLLVFRSSGWRLCFGGDPVPASKRRWTKFSWLKLLAPVALVCAALGLVVVPGERQRRALEAVRALNGSYTHTIIGLPANQSLRNQFLSRWLPRDYVDDVLYVDLASSKASDVTDADLAQLRGLTGLLWLQLKGCTRVTDAGIVHLQGLTRLQMLRLSETQLSDEGLGRLLGLQELDNLFLDGTQVSDAGLPYLQEFKKLKRLSLRSTRITDAGLSRLQELKNLQTLEVAGNPITDVGLARLRKLKSLRSLDLENTQLTDAGLVHLRALKHLEKLNLNSTQVTDAGLAHLQVLSGLEWLWLNQTKITNAGLAHLHRLKSLRYLHLEDTQATAAGVAQLKQTPGLSELFIIGP